ncbi:hypothetical protein FB451DRAFT_1285569 [Mycena latifolia]|nr:hypothetical protein FB451DRAFT_1285569 [Mycena latifolia]
MPRPAARSAHRRSAVITRFPIVCDLPPLPRRLLSSAPCHRILCHVIPPISAARLVFARAGCRGACPPSSAPTPDAPARSSFSAPAPLLATSSSSSLLASPSIPGCRLRFAFLRLLPSAASAYRCHVIPVHFHVRRSSHLVSGCCSALTSRERRGGQYAPRQRLRAKFWERWGVVDEWRQRRGEDKQWAYRGALHRARGAFRFWRPHMLIHCRSLALTSEPSFPRAHPPRGGRLRLSRAAASYRRARVLPQ